MVLAQIQDERLLADPVPMDDQTLLEQQEKTKKALAESLAADMDSEE